MIDTAFFNYIATKPHFLLLPLFQSIFSMTVWNTIDDRYSNVVLHIEMKPNFLIFWPLFKAFSLWQSGIISMMDTPIYWYN